LIAKPPVVAAAIQTPADWLQFLKQIADFFVRRSWRRKVLGIRGLRRFFWRPIVVALERLEHFVWIDVGRPDSAHVWKCVLETVDVTCSSASTYKGFWLIKNAHVERHERACAWRS
jgi:hypothetical protein